MSSASGGPVLDVDENEVQGFQGNSARDWLAENVDLVALTVELGAIVRSGIDSLPEERLWDFCVRVRGLQDDLARRLDQK